MAADQGDPGDPEREPDAHPQDADREHGVEQILVPRPSKAGEDDDSQSQAASMMRPSSDRTRVSRLGSMT